uniref:Axonemal dynein light intermediate polypeptide 1 n=1 Tax=Sphaeramia orbicularis TaxID=375764 RepID=A0A673CH97_9TELE
MDNSVRSECYHNSCTCNKQCFYFLFYFQVRPLRGKPDQRINSTPFLPPPKSTPFSSQHQTEEVLDAIFPPREWEEENQLWVQKVSSAPSTRLDVLQLGELLEKKLQQREAKETGICSVRRELYSQCFDELIRQATINCAEMGLMLLRVRNEIQMTLVAYQTLYESSVAFGIRKALQAEQGMTDLEKRISELESQKLELNKKLEDQRAKCDAIQKRESEKRQIEAKKHAEEIQFLKKINQQLKVEILFVSFFFFF